VKEKEVRIKKLERRKTLKFANAIAEMISSYEYEAKNKTKILCRIMCCG
jgi:hypothetical protein